MSAAVTIRDQHGLSRVGKVRTINQDAILVDPRHRVYVLTDGMGGHRGGEVAAAIAADILHTELIRPLKGETWENRILQTFEHAHAAIIHHGRENPEWRGMGTTALALVYDQGTLHIGHVGDSRVYFLTPEGTFLQATEDHVAYRTTPTGTMIPIPNLLARSLGHSDPLEVDYLTHSPLPASRLLMCSDGLYNMVADAEISKVLQEVTEARLACEQLVQLAYDGGGHDNVSVIVVYLEPSL